MFFLTRINGHRAMSMEKEGLSQHTETGQATAIRVKNTPHQTYQQDESSKPEAQRSRHMKAQIK
jgi:hypothetical protein